MLSRSRVVDYFFRSAVVFMVFVPMLVSCGVSESTSVYDKSKFLFIPVDTGITSPVCAIFLVLQGIAFYLNCFYRTKPGWRHEKVTRNIYDSRGDKIGSYETGETESWYVSEEKAENETRKVRYWGGVARDVLPRMFLTGCVLSWFLADHPVWMTILWLIIAGAWSYGCFDKAKERTPFNIWEVVYSVLLLICFIVYMD